MEYYVRGNNLSFVCLALVLVRTLRACDKICEQVDNAVRPELLSDMESLGRRVRKSQNDNAPFSNR